MSEEFDPYYKWLGIPPNEQPPNHYRLLGIQMFEDDHEVIDSAANRHMSYLQAMSTGAHVEEAQELLNVIATARRCLLNDKQKTRYDDKLRAELAPPAPEPVEEAKSVDPVVEEPVVENVDPIL